ncbi:MULTISPECIES: hypothetical protein [unclassified Streptomyces]|uniref:hypothetical protein n=1 Tax=unclassified Streptomyces TaxID=2593676 RepID=UPI000DAF24FE|nr:MULTISPECIES: hypothetical protein [unclassified Streptomyces]PZT72388.1 hypothetical protein DNK55_28010 [Streptomyces sp. AC1-42T]PZT81293.1 hypothetical protein DNK56_03560 [Streptomyces sp. AC1-42W]
MGDKGKLPPLNAQYHTTDFENMPYEDMLRMIRGVNPTAIMDRGTALVDAQAEIEKIGTELKEHVSRTTWKGKGGDAFHEWGDEFARETLKLADYAGAAGTSLQTAGQALSEVTAAMQGHPDATAMCYADAEKEKARLEAVEKARNEAIPQMNKLASYYLMAQQTIAAQQEPNFRPLPQEVMPSVDRYGWVVTPYNSAGPSTASPPESGGLVAGGSVAGTHAGVVQPVEGGSSPVAGVSTHAPQPTPIVSGAPDTTGTNIDTVTLPEAPVVTAPPATGTPVPQTPVSGGGQTPIPPVVLPSQTGPTGPGGGGTRRGEPVGPVGRGGVESVRPPAIVRADPGIHGGTPARPVTGPTGGGPRGTVIGGERPVTGPGMMGGHGVGAVGSPMGRGGVTGGSQRLVTRPGGTVRAPREAGAAREFTPGGSGLVRGPAGMGAMGPMGGAQGARRRTQRDGESPDYLTEDEETWATGGDGVVPPVID